MKRFMAISAATALTALTAFAMTGCLPGGKSPQKKTLSLLISSTERTDSRNETRITEIEWDETTGNKTGEVQKLNGVTVYETSDYQMVEDERGVVVTFVRTDHVDDSTVRYRVETIYGLIFGGNLLETAHREFLLGEGGDDTNPVLRTETSYNSNGLRSEFKRYENGVLTLHQSDFEYDSGSLGSRYTYTESVDGGEGIGMRYVGTESIGLAIVGYDLYSGWDNGNPSVGVLIENMHGYKEVSTVAEFTITRYDSEGKNGVDTDVENEYKIITISLE